MPFISSTVVAEPSSSNAVKAEDDFIEGNYWALIIGINKYPAMAKSDQLETAGKDAEAVAALLLARYGFEKECCAPLQIGQE